MAEIWYLTVDDISAETLKEKEPRYTAEFKDCIDLLELSPKRWKCESNELPQLKTGNPAIDMSGYLYVLAKVTEDEVGRPEGGQRDWKPGWYLSPLTMIVVERKLKQLRESERA